MRELDAVFRRLARSDFRRQFELGEYERGYLNRRGLDVIMEHGAEFVQERLAPAHPDNDGRQTPMKNHPVFIAQHATTTCCRGCLKKWHDIPERRPLSEEEQAYVLRVIERWIESKS